MDESVQKLLAPEVVTRKLSDVVRECGYGNPWSYQDCALARAYLATTGVPLVSAWMGDKVRSCITIASDALGIPLYVAQGIEGRCAVGDPQNEIADWLASQGY